ncbi:MAG: hypothetical protein J6J83_01365 [Oscillospiraceae bacterium]|nr:hypothetical protein [Oscillospiraceae bacterium]
MIRSLPVQSSADKSKFQTQGKAARTGGFFSLFSLFGIKRPQRSFSGYAKKHFRDDRFGGFACCFSNLFKKEIKKIFQFNCYLSHKTSNVD